VWLLAVDAVDQGMVARVYGFAVSNCLRVFTGGMVLGSDSTGVAIGGAVFSGVSVLLTLVALGRGAKGYVFDKIAFTVEQSEAGSTKRFLGHFTNKGDNHG